MEITKDDKQLFKYIGLFLIIVIVLEIIFGNKITPYIAFFAILLGAIYQLMLIKNKNKVFLFMGLFKPSKVIKMSVMIASWVIIVTCFIVAIIFLTIQFS